jgi:hypothetical protein
MPEEDRAMGDVAYLKRQAERCGRTMSSLRGRRHRARAERQSGAESSLAESRSARRSSTQDPFGFVLQFSEFAWLTGLGSFCNIGQADGRWRDAGREPEVPPPEWDGLKSSAI